MKTIELGRVSQETLGSRFTEFLIDASKLGDTAVHPTKLYNRGPTTQAVKKTENAD